MRALQLESAGRGGEAGHRCRGQGQKGHRSEMAAGEEKVGGEEGRRARTCKFRGRGKGPGGQ